MKRKLLTIPEYFESIEGKELFGKLVAERPVVFIIVKNYHYIQDVIIREFTGKGWDKENEPAAMLKSKVEKVEEPEAKEAEIVDDIPEDMPEDKLPPSNLEDNIDTAMPFPSPESSPPSSSNKKTVVPGVELEFTYNGQEMSGKFERFLDDKETEAVIAPKLGKKLIVESKDITGILV